MIQSTALIIEKEDLESEDKNLPFMSRLSSEAFSKATQAEIVIYDGTIFKDRHCTTAVDAYA